MAKKAKIGDRVFIPKLDQFGIVEDTTRYGRIIKIRIRTQHGEEVIEAEDLEVVFAVIIKGIARFVLRLFKRIFKKKQTN
jgi:hypothetical protein